MTANILKQNILAAKEEIKTAQTECWRAEQEARATCARTIAAPENYIEGLIVQHSERAQALAQEEGANPTNHWGGYLDPSDITVLEDGLHLSWDINGDYAPAYFLATWEELCKKE